jgi:succinate dehydrogenase/fumarate reductase flavoprotein subunit
MGNSLLGVLVYGRIAGENAALYVQNNYKEAKLSLDHVNTYLKELEEAGIRSNRVSPILLPDYTNSEIRRLPAFTSPKK